MSRAGRRIWVTGCARAGLFVLLAAFGSAIVAALSAANAAGEAEGLGGLAFASLERTGIESAVTGVLMSYRAYDTFLELVVLLIAFSGLRAGAMPLRVTAEAPPAVLSVLEQWLVPFLLLFAAYLLWAGAHIAGGAFQAGAVLAAAALLGVLAGGGERRLIGAGTARAAIVVGPFVFAAVGFGTLAFGDGLLTYPRGASKAWILLIETAATISIGATLLALLLGDALLGRGARRGNG